MADAPTTEIPVDPPGTVLTNKGRCGCCCLCRGAGGYWSAVELEFGFAGESLPGSNAFDPRRLGLSGVGVGRDAYADARDTDLQYGTSLFAREWVERHPCITWKSSGTLAFYPEPLPGEGIDQTICGYRGPATEFVSVGGGYYGSAAMEWRYAQPRPGFPSAPALAYVGPPWPNLPTVPDLPCTLKGTAVSPGSYGGVIVPPYVSSHYDHTADPLAFQFGCRPCTSDPHPAGTMTILYGWVPTAGDGFGAGTAYDFGYTADRAYSPLTTVLGWGPATLVAVEYVLDIDGQWVRNLYNSLGGGGFTGHRIPGFWRVKPAGAFKRCGACCDTPHRHRVTGRIVVPAGSPPGTPGPVLPVFGSPGIAPAQSPPGIDRHPDVPAQSWTLHMAAAQPVMNGSDTDYQTGWTLGVGSITCGRFTLPAPLSGGSPIGVGNWRLEGRTVNSTPGQDVFALAPAGCGPGPVARAAVRLFVPTTGPSVDGELIIDGIGSEEVVSSYPNLTFPPPTETYPDPPPDPTPPFWLSPFGSYNWTKPAVFQLFAGFRRPAPFRFWSLYSAGTCNDPTPPPNDSPQIVAQPWGWPLPPSPPSYVDVENLVVTATGRGVVTGTTYTITVTWVLWSGTGPGWRPQGTISPPVAPADGSVGSYTGVSGPDWLTFTEVSDELAQHSPCRTYRLAEVVW